MKQYNLNEYKVFAKGELLKLKFKLAKVISQKDFANIVGINEANLSSMLNGRHIPSFAVWMMMIDAYNELCSQPKDNENESDHTV